ncbi:MAG: hypothetical protein RB191_15440, partial [Terriglobia bacterium]|nr:hypothetical protein [Terriglobia bacterium]
MIEMKLTRFFTCEEADVACQLTFNCLDLKGAGARLVKFSEMPIPALPDMGKPWREMTNEEATAYMEQRDKD